MYLTQILHRGARQHPDKLALADANERITYAELLFAAARLAGALQAAGIGPGERVILAAGNSARHAAAYFGIWWLGAVACPLNLRWSPAEIAFAADDCAPGAIIVDDAGLPPGLEAYGARRGVIRLGAIGDAGGYPADERRGGGQPAAILYTGGTTGRPKGVVLTHANLASASLARLAGMPAFADSVCLLATPLFHAAALGRLLAHLMAGGTCIIPALFRPDAVLRLIEREGVTDAPLVPAMLQALLDHPDFMPDRLRSLRRIGYGAAPIADVLLDRTVATLPWIGFTQSYGMTESAALATASRPEDHDAAGRATGRVRSAGRACACVEVAIRGPDDADLPAGAVGEIVLRGSNIMAGYWNRPAETAAALAGGWLRTGDCGYLDEDGYLFVVDRLKDMIVTGGENVYSAEVENALARHSAVAQCAVFGVPSERWGEAVHAVVALRPGTTTDERELREHCRVLIAAYKCPQRIEFVPALPLSATGKVMKQALREPHWRGHARRVA